MNTTNLENPQDLLRRIAEKLAEGGLVEPEGGIVADGRWQRTGTVEKQHGRDGAYLAHIDYPASVTVHNFSSGFLKTFRLEDTSSLTAEERKALRNQIAERKREAVAELEQKREIARARARRLWGLARPADPNHGYLVDKSVKPYDVRQSGFCLVVPVYDKKYALSTLQYINDLGTKSFLKWGQKSGCHFVIESDLGKLADASKPIVIVEGYATGASVHEATGYPVVCSFDCGNLLPVAAIMRERHPEREITIGADRDKRTAQYPQLGGIGVAKATEAALAVDGTVVIPEIGQCTDLDWNDVLRLKGPEEVRRQFDNRQKPDPALVWERPVEFDDYNLPSFQREMLPSVLGDFCFGLAEELQIPTELAVANALTTAAIAAQGYYVVHLQANYHEELSLYTLTILEPSERKTSCASACRAPLVEFEREMRAVKAEKIRRQQSERKTLEKVIEKMRNDAAKARDPHERAQLIADISGMEAQMPDVEAMPQILADDITPESLAQVLSEQHERIGIIEAEGGIFDRLAGLYNNGVANLDIALKAFSGESVRVNRKSSSAIVLRHPHLSMSLSVQSVVLTARKAGAVFRGRGLDARFLYTMPQSKLGRRKVQGDTMPDAVMQRYHDKIQTILRTECEKDESGDYIPYILHLSPEALSLWQTFWKDVEAELAIGGDFDDMKDLGGKLPGAVARIAALFHLLDTDNPQGEAISSTTMQRAIACGLVFAAHSMAVYGLMDLDENFASAKKILAWIRQTKRTTFTSHELWRAKRGTFQRMENVKSGLSVLMERNFVRERRPSQCGVGRPAGPGYDVNPFVLWGVEDETAQ